MREKARTVAKCAGILLAGAVLGALLLAIAFALPINEGCVERTYELFEAEGWYPAAPVLSRSLDTHFHSYLPGVLDDSTDNLMFDTILNTERGNVLERAMWTGGYSYYWHGYAVILRPLLMVIDYSDIRVINHALHLLLLVLLGASLWSKKQKKGYILALFSSYILLMPMAMGLSLQFSWVFYIAVGGSIFLVRQKGTEGEKSYVYCFMIFGMLTSYFDLLTYPLITWGYPLLWQLAVSPDETEELQRLKRVVSSGVCWIAGYAGMWIMKWLIGSVVLGENIFESALSEVFFRAGMRERMTVLRRFEAVYTNWKHYEYKVYAWILVLWLAAFVLRSIYRGWGRGRNSYAHFLVGCSSVVWYLVLANHTVGHHFFTYRIFAVSILAFLLFVTDCTGESRDRQFSLATALGWLGIAVVSLGMACLAREEMSVTNGAMEHRGIVLAVGEALETDFTPTFSQINDFGMCLETEATEGELLVSLERDGKAVCQEKLQLEYTDVSLHPLKVDWKLQAGKTYRLRVELKDSDAPVYALISLQDEGGLAEYGSLNIGGRPEMGQLLTMLNYRNRPFSKKTLLFLMCTWMGILGSFGMVIRAAAGNFWKRVNIYKCNPIYNLISRNHSQQ